MEFLAILLLAAIFFLILKQSLKRAERKARRIKRTISPPEKRQQTRPHRSKSHPPFDPETAEDTERPRIISGSAYVIDGDSLVIRKTQVRLHGIDAPELTHPYGQKAKWAMVSLCKGQTITAEIYSEDAHGRTVARCRLNDGRDLSAELVKQGLAIDWPKFSGGEYRALEVPDARKKMWLADARQKGRMHVWKKFEERRKGGA